MARNPTVPRSLTAHEKSALRPYVDQADLERAVLYDGRVPWYLGRRFAGIVRGHRVYLRAGVYDAGTPAGLALLGHELTHVTQYRCGMTAWRYLLSALRGYRRSRYEQEAFAVQARIERDLRRADAAATAPSSRG